MSEFVRLPNRIVNLSAIAVIEFEAEQFVVHFPGGTKLLLNQDESAFLRDYLESNYSLMSDQAARLFEDLEIAPIFNQNDA